MSKKIFSFQNASKIEKYVLLVFLTFIIFAPAYMYSVSPTEQEKMSLKCMQKLVRTSAAGVTITQGELVVKPGMGFSDLSLKVEAICNSNKEIKYSGAIMPSQLY